MSDNKTIFALDIGTRSVVGLVGTFTESGLEVLATAQIEHDTRAMMDGQIHDVNEVARVIQEVKSQLEQTAGPLSKVAVAAAGRALKTVRTQIDHDMNGQRLTKEDILSLELQAVQKAEQELLQVGDNAVRYHCVGYTVLHYKLDESPISSLVDHLGVTASVGIIATFLPRVVTDSLQFALTRAGLEMHSLTLEPIAAINALIPTTMRKLNITLVDVGAGTSDIAITADGTVIAYGMVPVAGDEVTEALSHKYLLDFPVAEEMKRSLYMRETVSFTDVLGMNYELSTSEIIESLKPDVLQLATGIAEEILLLNGRPPQAVMLIGGGSQTPHLPQLLAEVLGIPKERVVIRGTDAIQQLSKQHEQLVGPQAVTPIGIALAAVTSPVSLLSIRVNKQSIHLFEFRRVTVGDALIAAGVDIRKLHGRPGLALTVDVCGERKLLRGTMGTPAVIHVNGEPIALKDILVNGDIIEVINGISGQDACATISELLGGLDPIRFTLNGESQEIWPLITMNDQTVTPNTAVTDRSQVSVTPRETLQEILGDYGYGEDIYEQRQLTITVNGEKRILPLSGTSVHVNGMVTRESQKIRTGDLIEVHRRDIRDPLVRDVLEQHETERPIVSVIVNGDFLDLQGPSPIVEMDGRKVGMDDELRDGSTLTTTTVNWTPNFADIFQYVHIDRERPSNAIGMIMEMNGLPVDFTTPLVPNAMIVVKWEVKSED